MPDGHKAGDEFVFTWSMNTGEVPEPKAGNRLWGIYHTDREYAHAQGNPLRTVVEAPTKIIAEEMAARLGFGNPWAHPVSQEEAKQAQWLPKRRIGQRRRLTHLPSSRGIRI